MPTAPYSLMITWISPQRLLRQVAPQQCRLAAPKEAGKDRNGAPSVPRHALLSTLRSRSSRLSSNGSAACRPYARRPATTPPWLPRAVDRPCDCPLCSWWRSNRRRPPARTAPVPYAAGGCVRAVPAGGWFRPIRSSPALDRADVPTSGSRRTSGRRARTCGATYDGRNGWRARKSSAISSIVTQRTPSCALMCPISRSSISSTCGRPLTSGWMVMGNTA